MSIKPRMINRPEEKGFFPQKEGNSMHMHYKVTRNSFSIASVYNTVCKKIYALDVANQARMKRSSRNTMGLH